MRAGQVGTHGIHNSLALWNTLNLNMSCIVIRVLNHWHGILLHLDNKINTTHAVWILIRTLGGGGIPVMP